MKRKTTIDLYIEDLIAIFVILAGAVIIFFGLLQNSRVTHAGNLEDLTEASCVSGQYVKGTMKEFAGIPNIRLGEGALDGSNRTYNVFLGKSYAFYTIPLKDGSYITVLIHERGIINRLSSDLSEFTGLPLECKIVRLPAEPDYDWLAEALALSSGKEAQEIVSSQYALLPVDFSDEKKAPAKGFSIFLSGILLWLLFHRIKAA